MPFELDRGHDEPIFGPGAKLDLAQRLKAADEIVQRVGPRAKKVVAAANPTRKRTTQIVQRRRRRRKV